MSAALVLLRLARLLAPAATRQRMAEEWQADLAGSSELGVAAIAIGRGALRTAAGARAALLAAVAVRAAVASSPVLVGVLVGAICALGDVSVLTVFGSAGLMHGVVLVVSSWRRRSAAQPAPPRRAV